MTIQWVDPQETQPGDLLYATVHVSPLPSGWIMLSESIAVHRVTNGDPPSYVGITPYRAVRGLSGDRFDLDDLLALDDMVEPRDIFSTIDDVLTCQFERCSKPSAGSEFCSSEHLRAWHEQFAEPLEYSPDAASVYPGYDSARWIPEGGDELAAEPAARTGRLIGEQTFSARIAPRGIQEGQELLTGGWVQR